jgi:deoxyhypusine synthase
MKEEKLKKAFSKIKKEIFNLKEEVSRIGINKNPIKELDYSNKLKTTPLKERESLFDINKIISLKESQILSNNKDLKNLAKEIKKARQKNKQFILFMGAHLIKLGLSEFIIDLIKKKYITHIGITGSFVIHDFEIAFIGKTSEDVEKSLKKGTFGLAHETSPYICKAAKTASENNTGLGYEIGKLISDLSFLHKEKSILYNAFKSNIPVTIHMTIGTDIIYQHPEFNGEAAAALGRSSYKDFKILVDSVSKLKEGVIVNLGSAVILPEVFLKAFAIVRNLEHIPKIKNFTAANIDMIDHYRPRKNIVERPTSLGGKGFIIIEKHEKSIPTLHYLLTNKS